MISQFFIQTYFLHPFTKRDQVGWDYYLFMILLHDFLIFLSSSKLVSRYEAGLTCQPSNGRKPNGQMAARTNNRKEIWPKRQIAERTDGRKHNCPNGQMTERIAKII